MKTLNMTVTDKVLVRDTTDEVIVCGNGDYQIQFAFDAEWNAFPKKTARFTWNGRHEDVEFNGNTCVIPMLINTGVVTVGVYAGEGGVDNKPLATTKVPVYCVEGSRCGDSSPNPNTGENYTNQAKGYAAEAGRSAEAAAASAEEAKAAADGAGGLKELGSVSYLLGAVNLSAPDDAMWALAFTAKPKFVRIDNPYWVSNSTAMFTCSRGVCEYGYNEVMSCADFNAVNDYGNYESPKKIYVSNEVQTLIDNFDSNPYQNIIFTFYA